MFAINYLSELFFGAESTENECGKLNMCVIGDNVENKKKFIDSFNDNNNEKFGTIGTDFVVKKKQIGNDMYEVAFWDFAGYQPSNLSLLDSTIKNMTGFFVMIDETNPESENNAKIWKNKIDQHIAQKENKPSILMVYNNNSLNQDQIDALDVKYEQFCKENAFAAWVIISKNSFFCKRNDPNKWDVTSGTKINPDSYLCVVHEMMLQMCKT